MSGVRQVVMIAMLLAQLMCCGGVLYGAEQWQGIDEAVVQRIAREYGREAGKPLIDTGQGDLQLFVFLAAGAVGGFIAGYCWRTLLEGKREK